MERLFDLGQIVVTRTAIDTVPAEDILSGLRKHATGDWGELCDEDRDLNETSLQSGQRIFSAYADRFGTRYWIITEWDRSLTTILLPDDY